MNCFFLTLTVLSACGLSQAQSVPPTWGRYFLSLSEKAGTQDQPPVQQLLVKQAGRTVLSVTDQMLKVRLIPLRPGGLPELVITTFSGGAHCCSTVLMYTQDNGKISNIGVLDAQNYEPSYADLNGDGTQEVLVASDSLAYYDWPYAVSPRLRAVLGWDGTRLADQTRRYAYVPLQEGQRNLKDLLTALPTQQTEWDNLKARLGGYYGNMLLAGQGAEADRVLNTQVFPHAERLRNWFVGHRAGLVNATYAQPETRLTLNDGPIYPWPKQNQ